MKLKKLASVLLVGAMVATTLVGCGGSDSSSGSEGSGDGTAITIFNSKTEIQEYLEDAAAEYGEANGVDIEVCFSSDTVSAHLASKNAASEPYTINMVDAKCTAASW